MKGKVCKKKKKCENRRDISVKVKRTSTIDNNWQ